MRVLVTGATGFVGFHAVKRLLGEGHGVRALVRDRDKGARVLRPLGVAEEDLIVGDMTDGEAVTRALEGCDAVIHAAAGVSVTAGRTDFEANIEGTRTVVGAATAAGAETVYVSSLTAIFDPKRETTESSPLAESRTHYGRSKAAADAWVRARQQEGAPIGIVYPSGVVGPDDPGFSESVRAYRSFLRGTLQTEGGTQLVDVRDLALLLSRMLEQKTHGRVIAAGPHFSWDEFTTLLEQVTGATVSRIKAPGWVLRGAARGADLVGRLSGRSMPLTGEGVEIATRWRPIADSAQVRELGVVWRDPAETLADLFRWYVEAGRLPAKAVPALVQQSE